MATDSFYRHEVGTVLTGFVGENKTELLWTDLTLELASGVMLAGASAAVMAAAAVL
jgi:hypothetical protein